MDCADGSDEARDLCGELNFLPYIVYIVYILILILAEKWVCPEGSFQCLNGTPSCIYQTRLCDNIKHCQDNSDESQCGKDSRHLKIYGNLYTLYLGVCGGNFSIQNNIITSPLYPDEYPTRSDCLYQISGSNSTFINLTILTFNVKWNEIFKCKDDLVEIRDGSSHNTPLIGKFCGNGIPTSIHSTTNSIWIR